MARIILTVINNNTGSASYQGVRHEGAYEDLQALFRKYTKEANSHWWSGYGKAWGTPYAWWSDWSYTYEYTLRKN